MASFINTIKNVASTIVNVAKRIRSYLLKEDGDYLLLEDGFKILIDKGNEYTNPDKISATITNVTKN
jgi:hypothetical protein